MTGRKNNVVPLPTDNDAVGYKRPPVRNRFKPGQSGNPSGRPKGSQNLKALFNRILKEEVSLREGAEVRKVTKAEAVLRSVVIGALKGDQRAVTTMFKLAEQTGHFEETNSVSQITRVIVGWKEYSEGNGEVFVNTGVPRADDQVPANSDINKEES